VSRETQAVPDWQLERFRLGELPREEHEALEEAVERDASLRERLARLERDDRAILAAHPPPAVAERIRRRGPATDAPRHGRPFLALGAAAAVAIGLWALAPAWRAPGPEPPGDTTRVKGSGPHLLLYRQAAAGAELLADGAGVKPRDVIQVLYVAAGQRYGVVVSVDGRGGLSVHLPSGGREAAPLDAEGPTTLASAWELDDAPAFERFFFVTSKAPFAVAAVTEALRRTPPGADPARLDLPPELEQSTVVLRKDGPR